MKRKILFQDWEEFVGDNEVAPNTSLLNDYFTFVVITTNFNITSNIANIIQKTDGVETLQVYTRYRARIGVPKGDLFDVECVKDSIQDNIQQFFDNKRLQQLMLIQDEETKANILKTINSCNSRYDYWTILVMPNGSMEVVGTFVKDKEYIDKINELEVAMDTIPNCLMLSEML